MAIDWEQAAVNAVPSVLAAVLSAGLTARWALTRFRAEKWWERKVDTYTEIARALFLVKRYVGDWVESNETGVVHTSEYQKQLLADWHKGARAVEEATVLGSFIISPKAAQVLAELQRQKCSGDPDDPGDGATRELEALGVAIPAFTSAARTDLGLGNKAV